MAHGLRKKRLDFGGNPDHIVLFRVWVVLGYGSGGWVIVILRRSTQTALRQYRGYDSASTYPYVSPSINI